MTGTVLDSTKYHAGKTVDRAVIREDISKGHRVRGWNLAANVGGKWVPTPYKWGSLQSSNGTGVGNRFTAVFNQALPASATQLRLIITAAVAEPVLAMFAACVTVPSLTSALVPFSFNCLYC